MKRVKVGCLLFLLVTMFTVAAQASNIVCVQNNALGADFEYCIMEATLDNGQIIYYLATDGSGWYQMEDVNFDGHDDFVPATTRGASNFFSAFYLYNPQTGQYEPVYTGDQGLCNYTLDQEKRYVVSSVNDGYRNGETKIYAWQGSMLTLLRSATVGSVHTVEFDGVGMTERWDFSHYEMIIRDYTTEAAGGQIIYQQTYLDDDPLYEEHLLALDSLLWDGM